MLEVNILESEKLDYLTHVLDEALHKVEDELRKKFTSVEYEIYPFDTNRIVITASGEKIGNEKIGETELLIPIVDDRAYSISIENLRIAQNHLIGEVGCFTWRGQLVTIKSPTEFYRSNVEKMKLNNLFSKYLYFKEDKDIDEIARDILNIFEKCVTKMRKKFNNLTSL
jgi:hypothetical protein